MILSKENLRHICATGIEKPTEASLSMQEKVLQFGTGVLLRGLPDYFIDKANRKGIFNGSVVVVKSTGNGSTDEFEAQDGLFTHYIKGVEDGIRKEETIINSSISRVLSAVDKWEEILAYASNENMQIIISNTTEVGLTLLRNDNIFAEPPVSFPGKLTAFLYARYTAFNGAADKGMVIIPTELIPDNGIILRDICNQLAKDNGLEESFIEWLNTANDFCNSLVDRIVPGALPAEEVAAINAKNGYEDALHISSETYRLWVIETKRDSTHEILSFAKADDGVVITGNIQKFRDLKLRLLNGSHTFICGLAILSDFTTVKEAMANPFFAGFITSLLHDEIIPTIIGKDLTMAEAATFANKVLDRFRNPFIEHLWLSICVQYTSKMKMRCVPSILEFYKRNKELPKHMAAGFGAYVLFMRSHLDDEGQYVGYAWGTEYVIQDDKARILYQYWQAKSLDATIYGILSDKGLWGTNLAQLPGFEKEVISTVRKFLDQRDGIQLRSSSILAA